MDLSTFYALTDLEIFLSFLGFILVLIPLWWHLESWNTGCIIYIFWSSTLCLIQGINLIIWKDNVIDWAPVWCDITSRWKLAGDLGIVCASLCINRRLYTIASVSFVTQTSYDKRKNMYFDLGVGLGAPIVYAAIYWFYEGFRYDLVEGLGCDTDIPNTYLSYFLGSMWPVIISLISITYGVLSLRSFWLRRKSFNELLSSGSNVTFNRYWRLMALSMTDVFITLPFSIWAIATSAQAPIYVWRGLADVHFDFDDIPQIPAIEWLPVYGSRVGVYVDIWIPILSAFLFFGFFGFGEEAKRHYHLVAVTVVGWFGLKVTEKTQQPNADNRLVTLPSFILPSFIRPKPDGPSSHGFSHGRHASGSSDSMTMTLDDMSTLDCKLDSKESTEKPLPDPPSSPKSPIDLAGAFRSRPDVPSPVCSYSYDVV